MKAAIGEEDLRNRLATTYGAAVKAGNASAYVSIHVAKDIWDALHALVSGLNMTSEDKISLSWGYPIVREDGWPEGTIKVRTETVIY